MATCHVIEKKAMISKMYRKDDKMIVGYLPDPSVVGHAPAQELVTHKLFLW
jgi:hypothetical protein